LFPTKKDRSADLFSYNPESQTKLFHSVSKGKKKKKNKRGRAATEKGAKWKEMKRDEGLEE
jgi:hypothetical protein